MKKALLVIDYIKGIAKTGSCADYLREHPEVVANTNALIRFARGQGMPIIHVRLAFTPDYQGLPKYAPTATFIQEHHKFLLGTPETEFIEEVDVKADDLIVNKKYGNPFYQSSLDDLLQANGIEGIILTGVATDNAILYAANTAIEQGYHVTVVSDACGAPTATAHENALAIMKGRTVTALVTTVEL